MRLERNLMSKTVLHQTFSLVSLDSLLLGYSQLSRIGSLGNEVEILALPQEISVGAES